MMNRLFIGNSDRENISMGAVFHRLRGPIVASVAVLAALPVGRAALIAEWDYSEGGGSILLDSVGSNTGVIHNATWVADSPPAGGQALQFSGATNSFVDFGTNLALTPPSMTVAVWAKATGNHINQSLVSRYESIPGSFEIAFSQVGGQLFFRVWAPGDTFIGYGVADPFTSVEFNDDEWHHLAATFDGATRVAALYVDGALVHSLTTSTNFLQTTQPLYAGQRATTGTRIPYTGLMGFTQIYGDALTAAQIEALSIPEPDVAWALAIGIVGLSGVAWSRHRRHPRDRPISHES